MNPRTIDGRLAAGNSRFALVVARFNELVTSRLLEGALDTLRRHGAAEEQVTVVRVPGSFELPLVADRLARSGQFDAVCCLGAVIQGQTTHHEYINQQVARGFMQTSLETGVPVLFGVLTCQTMEQALDRAGGKAGNKGAEAVLAALEVVDVLGQLPEAEQG
ncbi:MAG: 6,7-dimethyl-8-ribityllumazine synthase [Planctomycetaceae bacterium]|nr:6,7-dimethyl-8-ribityllumazine synthase [Planctomycetaceae bacterium]